MKIGVSYSRSTSWANEYGDRTQDLSIRSQAPYHYATALPKNNFVPVLYQLHVHVRIYSRHVILRSDWLNHCDMK